jgi:hypothetical protein
MERPGRVEDARALAVLMARTRHWGDAMGLWLDSHLVLLRHVTNTATAVSAFLQTATLRFDRESGALYDLRQIPDGPEFGWARGRPVGEPPRHTSFFTGAALSELRLDVARLDPDGLAAVREVVRPYLDEELAWLRMLAVYLVWAPGWEDARCRSILHDVDGDATSFEQILALLTARDAGPVLSLLPALDSGVRVVASQFCLSFVDGMGMDAVPVLAAWIDGSKDTGCVTPAATALACIPSDEAMGALLARAHRKGTAAALKLARKRYPERMARAEAAPVPVVPVATATAFEAEWVVVEGAERPKVPGAARLVAAACVEGSDAAAIDEELRALWWPTLREARWLAHQRPAVQVWCMTRVIDHYAAWDGLEPAFTSCEPLLGRLVGAYGELGAHGTAKVTGEALVLWQEVAQGAETAREAEAWERRWKKLDAAFERVAEDRAALRRELLCAHAQEFAAAR